MTLIQIANMNERIKKLAEQCGFKSNPDIYDRNQSFDIPKFAELIVAECLGIVDDAERAGSNDIWDNAVKFIRRDLQEHFGVEEPVQVSNLHYCPYAAEINGDYETLCDCDEERTYQCAMDT